VKRKPAKRKTAKKSAKSLRNLGGETLRNLPSKWEGGAKLRTEISGVPLPPDLEQGIRYYSLKNTSILVSRLNSGLVCGNEVEDDEIYTPLRMEQGHVDEILDSVIDSMRDAFYLAILHYADDLKQSAKAAPLLEGLRQAARKGAAARRKQAAPIHKEIRKRFRELRKTTPKKTVRYLRVAEEFGISDRQVARIVDGID
jgi:hypothetical protein